MVHVAVSDCVSQSVAMPCVLRVYGCVHSIPYRSAVHLHCGVCATAAQAARAPVGHEMLGLHKAMLLASRQVLWRLAASRQEEVRTAVAVLVIARSTNCHQLHICISSTPTLHWKPQARMVLPPCLRPHWPPCGSGTFVQLRWWITWSGSRGTGVGQPPCDASQQELGF